MRGKGSIKVPMVKKGPQTGGEMIFYCLLMPYPACLEQAELYVSYSVACLL